MHRPRLPSAVTSYWDGISSYGTCLSSPVTSPVFSNILSSHQRRHSFSESNFIPSSTVFLAPYLLLGDQYAFPMEL